MNNKTKKTLLTVAAILIVAVLAFLYLKKSANPVPGENEGADVTVGTVVHDTGEAASSESEPEASQGTKESIADTSKEEAASKETLPGLKVDRNGTYTDKEHVAAYLHEFGCLPSNYITKKEAEDLGWVSSKGNLNKVASGKSIGGDRFGNYEKQLPVKKGRQYYECDIDYKKGSRNAKRIIYSNDGLIYYTEDHYESFTLLFGEE